MGDKSDLIERTRRVMIHGKLHFKFDRTTLITIREFSYFNGLAAEHFPVNQQHIERGLNSLDTHPQLCKEVLKNPIVKLRMIVAERVISDEKSKRESIRNKNTAAKESMGLK